MDNSILGIDISKAKFDVVLLHKGQRVAAEFANTPGGFGQLSRWLKRHRVQVLHACMEATGTYGDGLAEYLHGQGFAVSLVNPARIKAYAQSKLQRTKTDRSDARVIADFCHTQHPDQWSPPPPALKELRALVRYLEDLRQVRTQQLNRLQSPPASPAVRQSLQQHITFLDQQIQQVEDQIRDHIDQHPDLRHQKELLTSIPGIGDSTACSLLAEIGDWRAFASARQLAAFAGLTPLQRTSGSSIHSRSRLTKIGNPHLRRLLYLPALTARRCNPIIKPFCDHLADQHKPKMTVIGAAMRKLLHIAFGVLKSDQPFDPHYLQRRFSLMA